MLKQQQPQQHQVLCHVEVKKLLQVKAAFLFRQLNPVLVMGRFVLLKTGWYSLKNVELVCVWEYQMTGRNSINGWRKKNSRICLWLKMRQVNSLAYARDLNLG